MGYVDVAGVGHTLPDGRQLFADVSFRVGEGAKVALVGPNGAGKTTLLRMVAGDLPVRAGTVAHSGGLGVMRQFIGMISAAGSAGPDDSAGRTLIDLALELAAPRVRAGGKRLAAAEAALRAEEEAHRGTVLAVTHDRWFARSFDRFILFTGDGEVAETAEPVWTR